MQKKYIGYHGTTKKCANSIIEDKFKPNLKNQDNLYLGKGIYFYIEYEDAVWWNIKKMIKYSKTVEYLNQNYDIIESEIEVDENNILDLNKTTNLKIIDETIEKLKGKLKTKTEYIYSKNKDGAVINFLYKYHKLDNIYLISRIIPEEIKKTDIHKINKIFRVVLCVKNDNIIKSIKVKDKVGEEIFNNLIHFAV